LILTTQPEVLDGVDDTTVRPQIRAEYDSTGNQTAAIDADGHRTQFVYDASHQHTTTRFPDGTSTHVQYDPLENVARPTGREGRAASYGHGLLGRLLSGPLQLPEAGSDAPVTTYPYDEAGNLLPQTDALKHTPHYRHDELNRLVETVLPLGQTETLGY